jgi:hypothetical protein
MSNATVEPKKLYNPLLTSDDPTAPYGAPKNHSPGISAFAIPDDWDRNDALFRSDLVLQSCDRLLIAAS